MRKTVPAATRRPQPTLSRFDEHRVALLRARIDELMPTFARAVAEEDRLYDKIHALQGEIDAITRLHLPADALRIYPELSGDPITITVRTGYLEKKIRFEVGDYRQMKRVGLYPYTRSIAETIAKHLTALGAHATVDGHQAVSILTQEMREARLAAWAERLEGERVDDDE